MEIPRNNLKVRKHRKNYYALPQGKLSALMEATFNQQKTSLRPHTPTSFLANYGGLNISQQHLAKG